MRKLILALSLALVPASAASGQPNVITRENQKPGTTDWILTKVIRDENEPYSKGWHRRKQVEGFASHTSISAGESLKVYVSTEPADRFRLDIFRMGYYGGKGARLMRSIGPIQGAVQPTPKDGERNLVECQWKEAVSLRIPPEWVSGVYLGKLSTLQTDGQAYIVFVVRDSRKADLMFQTSDMTWLSYNRWPNWRSLYDRHGDPWGAGGSRIGYDVSFNKPYALYWNLLPTGFEPLTNGSGEFLLTEYSLAFWLEKEGYDVTYIANVDTHADGPGLLRSKVFLSVGHDEYWTQQMFDNVTKARDAGVSLAFLSGNSLSGIVELLPGADGRPNRVMRRIRGFTNEPELMGSTSYGVGLGDWIVEASDHWVFEGTGMKKGDRVGQLVGWEYHGPPFGKHPDLVVLAAGPVANGRGEPIEGRSYATTIYTAARGNLVFNAGTCWWNKVLAAPPAYIHPIRKFFSEGDARIQRITKNVLTRMLEVPVAPAQSTTRLRGTWRDYGGGADSAQYSGLSQINRANVTTLQVAWTYPTGDANNYLFNPLVIDGVMYVLARNNSIVALDAATGKELWIHENPKGRITTRGINYWESSDRKERRLLYSHNNLLLSIDAVTGESIDSFGVNGRVDLREGLDRDPGKISVQSGTPGRVFENLIILGSATNQEYDSAPGDIRAYDVRSGKLVWTFHTIPREGEFGYETWPKEAWKTIGGANNWAEMSVDQTRAIVYVTTGSPKYNFYGANRPGANLFGDCLLALDARTGKRIWHFQMVHHDIWDYDNATAPKLLTVRHEGKMVDVVAQAGKTGFLYVFDRVTGKPLWPIEERPVPRSDMPGEETWPTQPFPVAPPPFARQTFTEKDLNPFIGDPAERARFLEDIRSARNEGLFTPPSLRGTIQMPGNNGGANFSGAAVDPEHGTMFVVSKDFPALLKLVPPPQPDSSPTEPQDPRTIRYKSSFGFMITSSGLSAIAPPWTTMTAYDLNKGTIKWQVPLGEVPELAAKGIADTGGHFPKVGPVVTAGGLIFTGTRDRQVRALDVETGTVLWKAEVGAGIEGIPAVYELNGKQYVVYCAAARATTRTHASPWGPASDEPIQGAYVAFALPEKPAPR